MENFIFCAMFNASKKWDLEKNYYQTTCSEASIQRCSEK